MCVPPDLSAGAGVTDFCTSLRILQSDCFVGVKLQAPTAVCLERNRRREAADRVPDFSIEHMAEVFEWPPSGGNTWEAQDRWGQFTADVWD